jgi:hypothetical protein
MIYPATHDIVILQNATWKAALRATQQRIPIDSITGSGGPVLFASSCHKLTTNDSVVFTAYASGHPIVPCGLSLNTVYYVISSGLTSGNFYVAASISGSAISASGNASGNFYAAKPVNLSGYTVDADIRGVVENQHVATFACSVTNAANGEFQVSMAPAVSSGIEPGRYNYDVSLTSSAGESYYWLTGTATVQRTYSRN